jgi:rare lipoprotein A
MKNKLIFTISMFILGSYITNPITTAEASKHKAHNSGSTNHHKHHANSAHHARSAHKSRHTYAYTSSFHSLASDSNSREGLASYYGSRFHGRKTASGERYDMFAMTAAHKSLPLRSYAEITNTTNNKHVIVRINDRGPYHRHRIMDLSYAAAKELGIQGAGTGNIKITPL